MLIVEVNGNIEKVKDQKIKAIIMTIITMTVITNLFFKKDFRVFI